jgi:putative transposase
MSYTTLWTIPDKLWKRFEKILPPDKAPGTVGHPAIPNRQVMNGILHVLRTGCQWKSLKTAWFGASSSIHDRFQAWRRAGLFQKIFKALVEFYHRRKRIKWHWQSIDSKSVPAPLGGPKTGKNPTDRAKLGSKRHILVDGRGAPLAVVISGANAHDKTCAVEVLDSIIVPRPQTHYCVHHFCADKGYDYEDIRQAATERHYKVHIARRGVIVEEIPEKKRHPARRWVVERTLSWQNDFRSLRVRWSKNPENWLALNHLACALVLWQMATR